MVTSQQKGVTYQVHNKGVRERGRKERGRGAQYASKERLPNLNYNVHTAGIVYAAVDIGQSSGYSQVFVLLEM